jgi:hypothetical protein
MFVFPRRLVVSEVSVIHPAAASFAGGAARTPGFAATARDASKRRAYRQASSALPFVPMSAESFGRLGALALTLLGDLADQAMQAGGFGLSRAAFILGVLRELSVALFRGNASLCRSGAYVATRAAGQTPTHGAWPWTEVVSTFVESLCAMAACPDTGPALAPYSSASAFQGGASAWAMRSAQAFPAAPTT